MPRKVAEHLTGEAITFRLLQPDHLILVPGWVNGAGPFQFILDTGASMMVITPDVALAAGIRQQGRQASAMGANGNLDAIVVRLRSFKLGSVDTKTLSAAVVDLGTLSRPMNLELGGIVGYNLLRRYRITIDYRARLLSMVRTQ